MGEQYLTSIGHAEERAWGTEGVCGELGWAIEFKLHTEEMRV